MEEELLLSGYCRCLDGPRTVIAQTDGAHLVEADCGYGNCPHGGNCSIAQKLKELESSP